MPDTPPEDVRRGGCSEKMRKKREIRLTVGQRPGTPDEMRF